MAISYWLNDKNEWISIMIYQTYTVTFNVHKIHSSGVRVFYFFLRQSDDDDGYVTDKSKINHVDNWHYC